MTEVHTSKPSSIKIYSCQGAPTADHFCIGVNTTVQFEGDHDFGMVIDVKASGPYRPERIIQYDYTYNTLPVTEPSVLANESEAGKVFDWYQTRWKTLCESKTKNAKQVPESIRGVLLDDSHLHDLATQAFALGWADFLATDGGALQSRPTDDKMAVESQGRLSRYVGRALLSLIKIELTPTEYVEHDEPLNLFQYGPKATVASYSEHDRARYAEDEKYNVTYEDLEYTNQLRAKLTAKQIENGQESGNSMPASTSSRPGVKLLESSSS